MQRPDENAGPTQPLDPSRNQLRSGVDLSVGDGETCSVPTESLPTPVSVSEPPVTRIGRYRIDRELGKGAFGCVYAAYDESLNRTVAIKLLSRFASETDLQGWLAEARTLASLDHVAIVPVYDVGRTDAGIPYIVSKFIVGGSLQQQLRTARPTIVQAVRITIAVAQALGYAHEQRFVHRDIKPANILLTADGSPVVADFGLALHETAFGKGPRFVGTPAYMSPEQARSESHRVDGRSDIFSLGAVLYEMLTGHRVFATDRREDLLECIKTVEVRPPRQWNRQISRELDRICLKALAKRPSDRYSTAFDFAEELAQCLRELENIVPSSAASAPAEMSGKSDSQRDGSSRGSRSQQPAVIPRGLRSFDAADADFFPFLLPGARDRDGLPESIRFWRHRIGERDPDATFRVGVLLGPSGSGKSSLVRAGVLPHLPSHVVTLIADSHPERLGPYLLKRLIYLFPKLSDSETLHGALMALRQGNVLEPDQKLLLVLDQFEQWLNRPRESDEEGLLEALRQCDGARTQALLIVRDDFTIPLTRFMDELEEPLRQNHNFATVDRFGREHARHILTVFGRAYGIFPESPTAEQQKFINLAVEELETDGQLVPVRLALFADIVKDRPWDTNTLRQLGGARGVGVKFLEERIAGPAANPAVRSRVTLIKQLLVALLPGEGEQIKARARTLAELQAAVGAASADSVADTLALLDVELRLVTPRAAAAQDGSVDSARSDSSREPAYQLTHDFLVPSIRTWLDAEARATRAGRAKLRLRQLAESWSARPEPRRLPTLGEWLGIRFATTARDWSGQEKLMMHTAARRFARATFLTLGASLLLAFGGSQVFSRYQAGMLTDRLLNADTVEVNPILEQMRPYSRWTEPELRQLAEQFDAEPPSDDDRTRRRRLNLSLALAESDPRFLADIVAQLPTVPVQHLEHVRDRLSRHPEQVRPLVQQRLEAELATTSEAALAFGAVLLSVVEKPDDLHPFAAPLAKLLAGARTVHLADWARLYQPLAPLLLPALLRLYEAEAAEPSAARANLPELLALYARDDTAQLLAAVRHALPQEVPVLLANVPRDSLPFQSSLREALEVPERRAEGGDAERHPRSSAIPEPLQQAIDRAVGAIDPEHAWVSALAEEDFDELNRQLSALGFAVRCLRPVAERREIAAIWRRDDRETRVERALTLHEARSRQETLLANGWELVDFATTAGAEKPDELHWTLVWQKTNPQADAVRVYFERSAEEPDIADEWSESGFVMVRADARVDARGRMLSSAIWRKVSDDDTKAEVRWRYRSAFGDLRPGKVQTDLRSHSVHRLIDRLPLSDNYKRYWQTLLGHQHTATDKTDGAVSAGDVQRIYAARTLSEMGDAAAAEALLADVVKRRPNAAEIREAMGTILARAGKLAELRGEIAIYERFQRTGKPASLAFLRLYAAVLAKDEPAARSQLAQLEGRKEEDHDSRARYTRGLGVVAAADELGALPEEAAKRLVPALHEYQQANDSPSLNELLASIDFDRARARPELAKFLLDQGFSERLHGAYFEHPRFESRQLLMLPLSQHLYEATKLAEEGFLPVAIDVHVPAGKGEPVSSSVWQRSARDPAAAVVAARQKANLVLAAASFGQLDPLFDALRGRWGRDVQSHVIVHSVKIISSQIFVDRLLKSGNSSAEATQALLLSLGEFPWEQIHEKSRPHLIGLVRSSANSADDPGVRAAAEWCVKQWRQTTEDATKSESVASANWYRNSLGQVMIVIRPSKEFLMGSPPAEPAHDPDESLHWARLERPFAVAETEVTENQFQEFLKDSRVQAYYPRNAFTLRSTTGELSPQRGVTWQDAARFCEWLSEREGIPESQRCYPAAWERATKTPPAPAPHHRTRTGYRLPTEMEWEYFARAGSSTAYPYGSDESLLSAFEWVGRNSGGTPHPVGLLRPNRWGLFDVCGNVSEWCDDRGVGYNLRDDQSVRREELSETDQGKPESANRNVRGGHYGLTAGGCRSAARVVRQWDSGSTVIGFRVVRTMEAAR